MEEMVQGMCGEGVLGLCPLQALQSPNLQVFPNPEVSYGGFIV